MSRSILASPARTWFSPTMARCAALLRGCSGSTVGAAKPDYQPGMELIGKYVLIAEGARGSLARRIIDRFDLAGDREPQKFGLGMKELWEVRPEVHRRGQVTHTLGWPLGPAPAATPSCIISRTIWCRSVLWSISTIQPYLNPYMEFQRSSTIR